MTGYLPISVLGTDFKTLESYERQARPFFGDAPLISANQQTKKTFYLDADGGEMSVSLPAFLVRIRRPVMAANLKVQCMRRRYFKATAILMVPCAGDDFDNGLFFNFKIIYTNVSRSKLSRLICNIYSIKSDVLQ